MSVDVQKASIWKRISAFLFDGIMLSIVIMGFATLFQFVFKYDETLSSYQAIVSDVEEAHGIKLQVTKEEYDGYDDAKKAKYDAAYQALNDNSEAVRLYARVFILQILSFSLSMFIAFLLLEFFLPLVFKDGRTLGKKIFGLCLIRPNCVKISGPVLFIRSIIGKCVIETQIPVMIVLMFFNGKANLFLIVLLFAIPIVNLILFFATKNHTVLHDMLAVTVVADFSSQRIFETEDDLIEFKKKQHEIEVERAREPEYSHI